MLTYLISQFTDCGTEVTTNDDGRRLHSAQQWTATVGWSGCKNTNWIQVRHYGTATRTNMLQTRYLYMVAQ